MRLTKARPKKPMKILIVISRTDEFLMLQENKSRGVIKMLNKSLRYRYRITLTSEVSLSGNTELMTMMIINTDRVSMKIIKGMN
jgi:hypothetical protein